MSLTSIVKSTLKKSPLFPFLIKLYSIVIKCEIAYAQHRNKCLVKNVRARVAKGQKIRVGFYVLNASVFQTKRVYEMMVEHEMYDPFILAIPDTLRGEDNMFDQMEKTYDTFSKLGFNVYKSYDHNNNQFIDYAGDVDIIFFNNPYDSMTHEFYRSSYIRGKILYCHANYAYLGRTHYESHILKLSFYYTAWKIFIESERTYQEIQKFSYPANNLDIVGYCKLDSMFNIKEQVRARKRIIIAPHHTIFEWKGGLNLSNFLRFSDFFLRLPSLYPHVEFIFRPHPLLMINLKKHPSWGATKVDHYLNMFTSYENAIYDTSEGYLDYFVNSDALIHDCGSFLSEYLYTSHPQCYMLNGESLDKEFLKFGQDMLSVCYKAYDEQDLVNFIEHVVNKECDHMQQAREEFANKYVKHNYPNASLSILNMLDDTFANNKNN